MSLGVYSYLAAAVAYGFFAVLLLFSWRQSFQGKLLFLSILVSAFWALSSVKIALHDESYQFVYEVFEITRYIFWYVFLLKLFNVALPDLHHQGSSYSRFMRWALPVSVGLAVLLLINVVMAHVLLIPGQFVLGVAGNVLLALIGLALVEQLFRNTSARFRWATKYLFIGAAGIFAYDFYMYADALLYRSIDQDIWDARGIVHLVAVPLLAISSARNKNWSLNIFVSRDIVLNTTAILAGGFYLLVMAGVGYYLREFGGSWGRAGQVIFFTLAVVFLFSVVSSTQLRAQIKVFLAKHFYKNKYDYRVEWLRLTEDLSASIHSGNHYKIAIEALAHIVEARAGSMWLRDESSRYCNVGGWQERQFDEVLTKDASLIVFLQATGFVINLTELELRSEEYEGLAIPSWMIDVEQPWLIIPLHGIDELLGFVVLAKPLLMRPINWEDRDLLKMAAMQTANYLTVLSASAQLAQAKQFEVFSRLSAYMVHDLKNISAELDLVAINAKKHISNPEFVADAFETVENAAGDINRLLSQLRNKRVQDEKKILVDLTGLIEKVVGARQHQLPSPQFHVNGSGHQAFLQKNRLSNVLAHLLENAQQATAENGVVSIELSSSGDIVLVEIKDDGHGMDEGFIRNRLFKPFDTTKGNAGMGIGMFESREYIRELGGEILVQSKPGKGSILTLQIPAGSPQVDSADDLLA